VSAAARGRALHAAIAGAVATATFVSTQASGAYFASEWPLLAAAVILPTFALLAYGVRPPRWVGVGAVSLVAYGGWSLASVSWGGLPDPAWTSFDQALLGAAALVLGSLLVRWTAGDWLLGAIALGVTIEAVELLVRLQAGPVPADWFDGRKLQGPVGYPNAQAALLAVGIPVALLFAARGRLALRLAGGATAAILLGAMLLTQSRGGLLAVAVALAVQIGLAREARLTALAILLGLCGAVLWLPLRTVDDALVAGTERVRVDALRGYVGWVVLGAAVLALVAATPPAAAVVRRTLLAGSILLLLAAPVVVVVARPDAVDRVRSALSEAHSSVEPADLPGGETRLSSLSLTGRARTWRAALELYRAHPILGAGRGVFGRKWDRVRPHYNLSVLQPHSLELETLSEVGVPGSILLAAFVIAAFVAIVRRHIHALGGAAAPAAVLLALLLQASVDWTFSFPALVVSTLLVVGAAGGPGRRAKTGLPTQVILSIGALAAIVAYGGPYMAARDLEPASSALAHAPDRAWRLAGRAHRYDPWNAEVVDVQARAAAATGHLALSASLFARAAVLAQRPWQEELGRATVLAHAGRRTESLAACRAALDENPLEPVLRHGLCGVVAP
jgi:O-antigen ligase